MSNKIKRVVLDGQSPLVFAEKPKAVGNGGKAFKSVTAAVKAAEAARDEARAELADAREVAVAYRAGAEELLEAALGKLRRAERLMEGQVAKAKRWWLIDFACFTLWCVMMAVGCLLGWW